MIADLRGFDCYTNSPYQYQRKWTEKSVENIDADVKVLRVKVTPNLGGCIHTETLCAIHSLVGSNAHLVWALLWLWVEIPALLLYFWQLLKTICYFRKIAFIKNKNKLLQYVFSIDSSNSIGFKKRKPRWLILLNLSYWIQPRFLEPVSQKSW